MMIDRATQNRWILGEEVPGVAFRMNQNIMVVAGVHKGTRGTLISLYELGSDPLFALESKTGDYQVRQSEIQADN